LYIFPKKINNQSTVAKLIGKNQSIEENAAKKSLDQYLSSSQPNKNINHLSS